MLISLVLFGSRARGDHRLSSDVDLLGVVEDGPIKAERSVRGTSFYRYPLGYLREKSAQGDLFLLHLTSEGKVLHDTGGLFQDVRDRFVFNSSYGALIAQASAVVRFIVARKSTLHSRSTRKRLIWAVRTIVIANAAEQRKAIFSSAALAEFSGVPELKTAIDKRYVLQTSTLLEIAYEVVERHGYSREELKWPKALAAQRVLMRELGGVAGAVAVAKSGSKLSSGDAFNFSTNEY